MKCSHYLFPLSLLLGLITLLLLSLIGTNSVVTATSENPLYQEDFETYSASADPIGWMDTGAMSSGVEDDSLFKVYDVNGEKAFGTTSTAEDIHSHYVGGGSSGYSGYRYSGRMYMTHRRSGIGVTFHSQYPGTDAYYRLRRFNNNAFHINPHGTALTGGTNYTGIVPSPNTWYRFEVEIEDTDNRTEVRAKVWEDGTTEPVGWQVDTYDDSASRITAGTFGVWSYNSGSKYWDDIEVTPLLPPPPVSLTTASEGDGFVTVDPDQADYTLGQAVTLTAFANTGWVFTAWSGDLSSSINPATLTMDANKVVTATFSELSTYTLTLLADGNGTVTADSAQTEFTTGEVVTLTATADSGWAFTGWSGDLGGIINPTTLTMDADKVVTATFTEISTHTLALLTDGNGTVSADPDQTEFTTGEVVTLTATADPGWAFTGWSGDLSGGVNPATLTMDANKVITATFENLLYQEDFETYSVNADPIGWMDTGALSSGVEDDSLFKVYDVNGEKTFGTTLTAEDIHSHYVAGSSSGYSGYRYSGRMYMTHAKSGIGVTFHSQYPGTDAYYRLRRYNNNAFHINPHGTALTGGTNYTGIVPSPNTWYRFEVEIEDTGSRTEVRAKVWEDGTTEPAGWQVEAYDDSASRITAGTFGIWSYTSGSKYWDDIEVTPLLSHPPVNLLTASEGDGFVTVDPVQADYALGQTVTLTAIANTDWVFTAWSGDLSSSINPATLTMDANKVVTATFTEISTHTLTLLTDGNGTVTANPAQTEFTTGEVVTLTATADPGWSFTGWNGDLTGSSNPTTLTMDSDKVVTATYTEISTHTLSLLADGNGTVTTDPAQTEFTTGEAVTLTATAYPGWSFTSWNGDLTGSSSPAMLVMDSDKVVTAIFSINSSQPVIDVWYGLNQSFGQIGTPQNWVNILGNVSDPDGVVSLVYSLNAEPEKSLSIGPDLRRLQAQGDFNVDVDRMELVEGSNQLVLTTTDTLGNQSSETVVVNYESGNVWPLPYSVDWNSVTDIQDVAQVVDGKWSVGPEGLRTVEPGYDRLVAIGDISWADYEVTVPITIHDVEYVLPSTSGWPAVGVLIRWQGHTDQPVAGWQPKSGWEPNGNIGWWHFYSSTNVDLEWWRTGAVQAFIPDFETTYQLKLRVEESGGYYNYSLKAWEASQPEPASWNVTLQGDSSDLASGSFMLIAHYVDATFGDVTVVPLGGSQSPVITNIQSTADKSSAMISWTTDVPATSSVAYGSSTAYENGSVSDNALVTQHDITVTGLLTDTLYHYQVTSVDGSGNVASSGDLTFTTLGGNQPLVISNVHSTPDESFAVISWTTDELATSSVAYGLSTAYENGSVSDSTLVTQHAMTVTGLLTDTLYHYQATSVDGSGNSASSGDLTFTTTGGVSVSGIVSDDFSSCSLDTGLWTIVDPVGDATVTVIGSALEIGVPAGSNHDPWTVNEAARVTQAVNDTDFEVEVKFESAVSEKYQEQGILVEQDSANYVRFDFYSDGAATKIFAASFTNGSASTKLNSTIAGGAPLYMRVSRQADQWTMSYSYDGVGWTTGVSFGHSLIVNSAGPFAGNFGGTSAPAHTAVIDYFFDTAAPVVPEDGSASLYTLLVNTDGMGLVVQDPDQATYACNETVALTATPDLGWAFTGWSGDLSGNVNPTTLMMDADKVVTATFVTESDTIPPVVSNVQVAAGSTAATITWDTDEPATSSVAYGPSTAYENGSVNNSTLVTQHAITVTGLLTDTLYHYQATSVDGSGNAASSGDLTFTTTGGVSVSGIVSDDFSSCSLDTGLWTIVDPVGDATVTVNGSALEIGVPAGSNHDPWTVNEAARIMQAANDMDFEVEVKFESAVSEKYQGQGILVEQDSANYVRFDFYSDGAGTWIYAASFENGTPSTKLNSTIAGGGPLYMRVSRQGDQWTMSYSNDGVGWTTGVSFGHSLTVSSAGPFAGNFGGTGAPAHTAVIDYFFDMAAPVVPEDGNPGSC